jgi:hypothetical protein
VACHLPDRPNDVHRVDGRADYVAQEGREQEMIFLAEQNDFPSGGQAQLQVARSGHAGETAAQDDNGFCARIHAIFPPFEGHAEDRPHGGVHSWGVSPLVMTPNRPMLMI